MFCRICGIFIDRFKKFLYKNLAGFPVEYAYQFLETTDKICRNQKTLFVYVKES